MYRVPSPTDQTRRFQNVFDGTLNRQHSPPPAPLRWGGNSSETDETAARTPRMEALQNVPEARSWVKKAIEAIEAEVKWFYTVSKLSDLPDNEIAPELVSSRPVRHDAEQHSTFIALQTHFRLSVDMKKHAGLEAKDYESDVVVWAMKTIQRRYRSIDDWLKDSSIFKDVTIEQAEVPDTGAYVPTIPKRIDEIHITPIYSQRVEFPKEMRSIGPYGRLVKVHSLIHEATHLLDATKFQDWAYRGISKDDQGNETYRTQSAEIAMQNPDSYAYFALHIAKGIDRSLKMYE